MSGSVLTATASTVTKLPLVPFLNVEMIDLIWPAVNCRYIGRYDDAAEEADEAAEPEPASDGSGGKFDKPRFGREPEITTVTIYRTQFKHKHYGDDQQRTEPVLKIWRTTQQRDRPMTIKKNVVDQLYPTLMSK